MRILFKSVLVSDSRSSFAGKTMDLLAENGQWIKIASSIEEKADVVIEGNQLHLSPSVVDLRVHNT